MLIGPTIEQDKAFKALDAVVIHIKILLTTEIIAYSSFFKKPVSISPSLTRYTSQCWARISSKETSYNIKKEIKSSTNFSSQRTSKFQTK